MHLVIRSSWVSSDCKDIEFLEVLFYLTCFSLKKLEQGTTMSLMTTERRLLGKPFDKCKQRYAECLFFSQDILSQTSILICCAQPQSDAIAGVPSGRAERRGVKTGYYPSTANPVAPSEPQDGSMGDQEQEKVKM